MRIKIGNMSFNPDSMTDAEQAHTFWNTSFETLGGSPIKIEYKTMAHYRSRAALVRNWYHVRLARERLVKSYNFDMVYQLQLRRAIFDLMESYYFIIENDDYDCPEMDMLEGQYCCYSMKENPFKLYPCGCLENIDTEIDKRYIVPLVNKIIVEEDKKKNPLNYKESKFDFLMETKWKIAIKIFLWIGLPLIGAIIVKILEAIYI